MRINRNETSRILNKNNKKSDINKLIVKYNLNNDLYNTNYKKCINFLCFKRIKNIILLLLILTFIICLIIFFILYHSDKNNKVNISLYQYINNTNIDGYYIPKDKLLDIKKCSIENCKGCYGNSYNDTCTSCFSSYNPKFDENNKIITCEYIPPNPSTEIDVTLNDTATINITDNPINITTNYTIINNTHNSIEITTESSTENPTNKQIDSSIQTIINNIPSTPKTELIENKVTSDIPGQIDLSPETYTENTSEIKTEFSSENSIYEIKSEIMTQITTDIISQQTEISEIVSESIIINCKPGYYLPDGDQSNECKKCPILGCEICHGNDTINYCDSCFTNYTQKYIDNNIICIEYENCIDYNPKIFNECLKCDEEYVLYDGNCYAYSFVAEYDIGSNNQNLKLINLNSDYIEYIITGNKMTKNTNAFTFSQAGNHYVYFLIKNNPKTFGSLFTSSHNLISINFTSYFNTKNITNLHGMFRDCVKLISLNFSNFDTSNVKDMSYMFYNCSKLTSVNLQNFNTSNAETMYYMLGYCSSLNYLDL